MIKKRKYVLVTDSQDTIMCLGIYENYYEALGHAMDSIFQFKESYKGEGDIFQISDPFLLDSDAGEGIEITYKASCWEEPYKEMYCILYTDEESAE